MKNNNLLEQVDKHRSTFNKLGDTLSKILDLSFEKFDSDYHVSTCIVNGEEGLTFRVNQRQFISPEQESNIKAVFPIRVNNLEFKLLTIFDFDWDDERYWLPSIAFTVEEVSNAPASDQVFIYWEG